jgi:hypothetical protein
LGIEVEDLTNILIISAEKNLKKNRFIYWRDDTHWNEFGIFSAMKYISNSKSINKFNIYLLNKFSKKL